MEKNIISLGLLSTLIGSTQYCMLTAEASKFSFLSGVWRLARQLRLPFRERLLCSETSPEDYWRGPGTRRLRGTTYSRIVSPCPALGIRSQFVKSFCFSGGETTAGRSSRPSGQSRKLRRRRNCRVHHGQKRQRLLLHGNEHQAAGKTIGTP